MKADQLFLPYLALPFHTIIPLILTCLLTCHYFSTSRSISIDHEFDTEILKQLTILPVSGETLKYIGKFR